LRTYRKRANYKADSSIFAFLLKTWYLLHVKTKGSVWGNYNGISKLLFNEGQWFFLFLPLSLFLLLKMLKGEIKGEING
jgi:hypothetical protein